MALPTLASEEDITGILSKKSLWHEHPGVRTGQELTRGERAADMLRNGMGSWAFVACFMMIMAAWAVTNVFGLHERGWDPYPFILLNLFLSMLAGLQGAVLLIAAKRADQISAETALHTLENTETIKKLLEQNNFLLAEVKHLSGELHSHMVNNF